METQTRETSFVGRFSSIRPLKREEIPDRVYRHKQGSLSDLQAVKELDAMFAEVSKGDVKPYEIVGEINMESQEIIKAKTEKKRFLPSFRIILKNSLEKHNLSGKIDVVTRGERLFIVGRDSETKSKN